MKIPYRPAAVLLAGLLAACSSGAGGVVPSVQKANDFSRTPNFSVARNQQLSDADFESFVSPSITGPERERDLDLLKSMPPNLRGDFIYIDASGHVTSNRGVVPGHVEVSHVTLPGSRGPLGRLHSLYTPPTDASTGPFVRVYSQPNVSAAFGYATVNCNTSNVGGDHGFMYQGTFDPNGNGYDAGLQYTNDQRIDPFVNLGGNNYVYTGWNATPNRYQCFNGSNNMHVLVSSGILNGTTGFLFTALVNGDPTTTLLPPNQVPVIPAASSWVFFNLPGGFQAQPGNFSYGSGWNIPSPCANCIEKLMTSIGFATGNNFSNDISCFGACDGTATNHWDQVVMGELVQPCGPGRPAASVCTIEYPGDGVSWYASVQQEPNQSEAGAFIPYTGDYNQYETGIKLPGNVLGGQLRAAGDWHTYAPRVTRTPGPNPTMCHIRPSLCM